MAQFTFEGNLSNLAEIQKDFIKSTLLRRGFNSGKVVVEPVGEKGDNDFAHVKTIIYEGNDGTILKIIGKIAPVDEELRILMKTMELFNNEAMMYEEILPKFNEIQKFANLTKDEKVRFPICYGCLKEAPYELILLEDLRDSGFEMMDKFNPLSDDSVRLVLKDLARHHALSYALKHKEPATFTTYASKLCDMWIEMGAEHGLFKLFEMAENDLLQMMQDTDDKYKNMLKGTLTHIFKMFEELKAYEVGSKHSVILQGDCWNNNILYRLVDGKPVQDIMIDYQLSREGIPVVDLLYFMFHCTDHATRLKHYQAWIDYYHDNLDEALHKYGLNADRVFTKDQLDAEIRRYGKFSIRVAVMFSFMLVRESKDAVDLKALAGSAEEITDGLMTNMASAGMSIESVIKLKAKVIGMFDSAIEFGLG